VDKRIDGLGYEERRFGKTVMELSVVVEVGAWEWWKTKENKWSNAN